MPRARTFCATLSLSIVAVAGCDGTDPATAPRSGMPPNALVAGAIIVTNTDDDGPGTLRQAIADAPVGATVQFDPGIAGQTITLTTGELTIAKPLTIEGPAMGGVAISGGGLSRVLLVFWNIPVSLRNVTITGGISEGLGDGIANGGLLTLDHVTVSDNGPPLVGAMGSEGGGIYNYEEGQLTLVNSTVSRNRAEKGGGIASYGHVSLRSSTVAENSAALGGGILIGGSGDQTLQLEHTIVADNTAPQGANCSISAGLTVTYPGTSLSSDASCGTDPALVVADPLLGPLAANGGPTKTHALLQGSPAIDAVTSCTVSEDQRSVARPQGPACDIGAFEFDDYAKITLTVDPTVNVNPNTGIAVVSGKITCEEPGPVELEARLSQTQKVGRVSALMQATDVTTVDCTGTRFWSMALKPASGGFRSGTGTATARTRNTPTWVAPATTASAVKLYWGRK
jgi:large repetitive protein